jgi:hypothetical protein
MALGWGARALKDASDRNRVAGGSDPADRRSTPAASMERRLSIMEQRLQRIEKSADAPLKTLPADIHAIVAEAEHNLSATALTMRQTVASEVREQLRAEAASAVERAIDGSLGHRLEQLETTVEAHESRMSELRDCSLRTERNLQRLMEGIERLVNLQNRVPPAHSKEQGQRDPILEKLTV